MNYMWVLHHRQFIQEGKKSQERKYPGGGGVLTLTSYTYMCLPFGALFREIWYSDRGVSSEMKEPKLHKLGVFWANYCKKHPI